MFANRSFMERRNLPLLAAVLAGCDAAAGLVTTGDPSDAGEPPQVCATVCRDGSASHDTIAGAIADAPAGCIIEVCPGTYEENLEIAKPLTLRGTAGAEATIVQGQRAGPVAAVRDVREAWLTLEGLTVRGGDAERGGGVACSGADVRLRHVVLTGNRAQSGGGLHARDCRLELDATEVRDNRAVAGGGVAIEGGDATVRGCELRGNAAELQGGALHVAADALIADSVLADNESRWTGGAVYVDRHAPQLRGNTLTGNDAVDDGGGVYLHQSDALLADNALSGNTAGDDGGAIRAFESTCRMERNVIEGNCAEDGGGGIRVSHLPCVLVDNVVRDNTAGGSGGGLDLDNDSSQVRGGAVTGNTAPRGGGIYIYLWPWDGGVIEDVRVAGNEAGRGGGIYVEDNFQLVTLRGLAITGNTAGRGAGLSVRTSAVDVSRVVIAGNVAETSGGGIELGGDGAWTDPPWSDPCPCPPDDATADIAFVVVYENDASFGSAVWADSPAASVSSSIAFANSGTAVVAAPGTQLDWRYNDTSPAAFWGMSDPTGSRGNLAADPQFSDAAGGDFTLRPASPCTDAGDPTITDSDGTRADMGIYGGL